MSTIKYDDIDISLEDLLSNSDVNYLEYLKSRPGLNAESWTQAYNDIKSRGITGIRKQLGVDVNGNPIDRWFIDYNGEDFSGDNYGDVAWFLVNQAKGLAGVSGQKKEAKEKTKYDSTVLLSGLLLNLINDYGGNENIFARAWDDLDPFPEDNRGPQTFSDLKSYVNHVRNDQILGARHNVFLNKGKRYFYIDNNGIKHWVDPSVIEKYNVSKTPSEQGWEGTTYWDDYELTGLKDFSSAGTVSAEGKKSSLEAKRSSDGDVTEEENTDNSSFWDNVKSQLPGILEGVRLAGSLYNNNRTYKDLLAGIRPNLMQSYTTHRQVVGDEATKQAYYRRAAEGLTRAARPFTSDADRQMAYLFEAKRVGDELRAQGDLADNTEIRRTSDESNQHQWANVARNTEVANRNLAELNRTNLEKAILKAQKHLADWSSWENYLYGKEYRMRLQRDKDLAMLDYIYTLQTQDDTILLKYIKQRNALWPENGKVTPEILSKIDNLNSLIRKRQIELLKNRPSYSNNRWGLFAKSGTKLTYKKKDDLLYKAAKDVVDNFRKSTKRNRKDRKNRDYFKLYAHPKKYQQGGGLFSIFRPVAIGGESSVSTDLSAAASSSKSDSKKGSDLLDILKKLFDAINGKHGLSIDVASIYQEIGNMMSKAKAFGTELSSDDIASMYLSSMWKLNNIRQSKEIYDLAVKTIAENNAYNEFAVTSDGRYVTQDAKTKEIGFSKLSEINLSEGKLIPLTNLQLLYLRNYSSNMALGAGDNLMWNVVLNGVGKDVIAKTIKEMAGKFGSIEIKSDNITKQEAGRIRQGLALLQDAPDGYYKINNLNKDQQTNINYALNYISRMLPNNMKAILAINASMLGTTPGDLIASYLNSLADFTKELSITPLTGKAAKDTNGNSKDNGGDMTPSMAFFMGMGDRNTFVILDKTKDGLKVNTNSMSLLDSQGHNLGPSTLLGISLSMYGSQLDLNSATMGDVKISPNGQNNVLISDGMIYSTELPIDKQAAAQGIIKPDLSFLKNIEKADQQLRAMGITSRDNLTPEQINTINKVYRDNNLPIIYTQDGNGKPVLTSEYRRFAMLNGYATEDAFEGDMTFNDGALEVDDDKELKQFEGMMQAVTKNEKYKLDRGWFSGTNLYKGVIYIPMNSSTITALGGTGYKGTVNEYMNIDKLQQERDNALRLGYTNPGGNASILK